MDWSILPEPATTRILQYLPFLDRCRATSACRAWYSCFSSPTLWEQTIFTFQDPKDVNLLEYGRRFGHLIQHLTLKLDQVEKHNRINACKFLQILTELEKRRLNSLTIVFLGENPVFYAGAEFVECFKNLFKVGDHPQFKSVDFDRLRFTIGEDLVDVLIEHNPDIEKLHIQCDALICKVSPDCLRRVLTRCRKLRDVSLISPSLTEDVLKMFTESNRAPLEHLSLMMRSEQKFIEPISSQAWVAIRRHFPELRVSLGFDSTCQMHVISAVMKPEIPVFTMTLAVYGPVEEDMHYLPIYYSETIENLIIHPMNNVKFQNALIEVARKCTRLKSLQVYCVLPVDVIHQVLELCPEIRSRGTYILMSEAEPEPNWVMAKDRENWNKKS